MGYQIDITSCSLKANGLKKLPDGVDGEYMWELDKKNNTVNVLMTYFKWYGKWEDELLLLAKAGVSGIIETIGEEGEVTRYILNQKDDNPSKRRKRGLVEVYDGEVIFHKKPNRVM